MVTIVAVCDISRTALRWFASADMSCAAGSCRLSMETAVRNTSIVLACGTDFRKSTTGAGQLPRGRQVLLQLVEFAPAWAASRSRAGR